MAGSSPRARGTRQCVPDGTVPGRFIPAGAGNAWLFRSAIRSPAVHPRGRGERPALLAKDGTPTGSSPRARGTPRVLRGLRSRCRFIPAGAGNAVVVEEFQARVSVHPRGRGERPWRLTLAWLRGGSSPRARGTLKYRSFRFWLIRFIPAGAGNAPASPRASVRRTVHPRGRGERLRSTGMVDRAGGSSPRARGTPSRPLRSRAYRGSSPRARGTRLTHFSRALGHRFIPAGAGNAWLTDRDVRPAAVHPRGRGERAVLGGGFPAGVGSSPRARGTHRTPEIPRPRLRFIPAGAGNAGSGGLTQSL